MRVLLEEFGRTGIGTADGAVAAVVGVRSPLGAVAGLRLVREDFGRRESRAADRAI